VRGEGGLKNSDLGSSREDDGPRKRKVSATKRGNVYFKDYQRRGRDKDIERGEIAQNCISTMSFC